MDLREELLATDDRAIEQLDVPTLRRTKQGGNALYIRALSGVARDRITNMYMGVTGVSMIPPLLHETIVVLGVVDEAGAHVLTDGDRETIASKWGESIKVISDAVLKLSGMAPDSVETSAKNLKGDLNADFGSGSPSASDTL